MVFYFQLNILQSKNEKQTKSIEKFTRKQRPPQVRVGKCLLHVHSVGILYSVHILVDLQSGYSV